ncbi:unnamed protein product [Caenorhabditis brenneri]
MPIPILKLPFLALKVVIACGEDVELLGMSLCSRRTDRTIKACGRSPSVFRVDKDGMKRFNDLEKIQLLLSEDEHSNVKEKLGSRITKLSIRVSQVIELDFDIARFIEMTIKIVSESQRKKFTGCSKHLEFEGISVPFLFVNNQLNIIWNERLDGLQFFVKYFEKNFRLENCNWEFEDSVPDLRPLVSYLNSLPKKSEDVCGVRVETVSVERDATLSNSDFTYLLETVTHDFEGHIKISDNFKFTGQIATQRLFLSSAPWFDLECLLICKSEHIWVTGYEFTNEELRVFIEKWSTGELSYMKNVTVKLQETLNFDVVLKDLNLIVTPLQNLDRHFWRYPPYRRSQTIQGESGERARIESTPSEFTLKKLTH